ncbi:MAG: VTT domain-containing protein [Firmicutes bacterium]|nr:VTT domain-containing protein [Bacillota bacterium]
MKEMIKITNKKLKSFFDLDEKKTNIIRIVAICIIAILAIFLIKNVKLEDLNRWILENQDSAKLIYISSIAILPIFFFPISWIILAGGYVFGVIRGTLYTIIGVMISTPIMYFISKFLLRNNIIRFVDRHFDDKIKDALFSEDQRVLMIKFLVIRTFSPISYSMLNYISGVTTIKPLYYLFVNIIGLIPGVVIKINVGENFTDVKNPKFFLSLLLLVFVSVVGYVISKKIIKLKK